MPTSQKFRPIGFQLSGGAGGTVQFNLAIRPEDLRRPEPSRNSIQQTLGSPWLDSFGRGISHISLAGHQGWRGSLLQGDGEALFQELRDTVFLEWHKRRAQLIQQGQDPAQVKLVYIDTLDQITVLVAPDSFALNRSRTSPLLMRYSIELTILDDSHSPDADNDSIVSALSNPLRFLASITGLGGALQTIQNTYAQVQIGIGQAEAWIGPFQSLATNVMNLVNGGLADSVDGILDPLTANLVGIGLDVGGASANVFHAMAADTTLPSLTRAQLMAIAAAWGECVCNIGNGFTVGRTYTSYDDLLGSSYCSSTGGGSPPSVFATAGANPFTLLAPASVPPVAVTTAAQTALDTLNGDPITLAGSLPTVQAAAQTVASGITLNPASSTTMAAAA